jgi:hypothetical protein
MKNFKGGSLIKQFLPPKPIKRRYVGAFPLHTFRTSFKTATSTSRVMRAGVAQGEIVSPVLFSLYVNDIPTPSRHVELAQYADDTALIATSRDPSLLFGYL